MMKRLSAALLLSLWCGQLWGLKVPEVVQQHRLIHVQHDPDAWVLIDPIGMDATPDISATDRADITVFVAPPGKYLVRELINRDGKKTVNKATVHIVPIAPDPGPGPAPPPPGPGPEPPPPDPPKPAELRVLLLYETAATYPTQQMTALHSTAITDYLNKHCVRNTAGQPQWRKWDDDYTDEQMRFESEEWRKAYAKAKADSKGTLPWLLVDNGSTLISEPFPASETALMSVLKKYGGE